MSTKGMKIQKVRFRKTKEWWCRKDWKIHTTLIHTTRCSERLREGTGPDGPFVLPAQLKGRRERRGRKGSCMMHLHTSSKAKTKALAPWD